MKNINSNHEEIYNSIFNIPNSEEQLHLYLKKSFDDILQEYEQFYDQTIDELSTYLDLKAISFEQLYSNPYTKNGLELKSLVSFLGLKRTERMSKLLSRLKLNDLEDFLIDSKMIQAELNKLSDKHHFEKPFHKAILAMVSKMVELKLRLKFEELLNHIKKIKDGTVANSKNLTDKGFRMVKENKPKEQYENEIEEFMFSEAGLSSLKVGKRLLSKNKTGSYNMRDIIEPLFTALRDASDLNKLSKSQQYIAVYPLFREIYPERKMYMDEKEFNDEDEKSYLNFEDYQIGSIKTILGVTR